MEVEPGIKKYPLPIQEFPKSGGLDTGVFREDSSGSLTLQTWESKWHLASDYSAKLPKNAMADRLSVAETKNKGFFESTNFSELITHPKGGQYVAKQAEYVFKINGWEWGPQSSDLKLVKGLWSTLGREEFDRVFLEIQKNPDFKEFLAEQMVKGHLDQLQFDHISWNLDMAPTTDGVLEKTIADKLTNTLH